MIKFDAAIIRLYKTYYCIENGTRAFCIKDLTKNQRIFN